VIIGSLSAIDRNHCAPSIGTSVRNRRNPHSFSDCLLLVDLQSDADLSGFIVGKMNAGLFKGLLYLEDGGEISFHHSVVLFNAPQSCQTNTRPSGKLVLAPA
jgi:hypothetical protein